MQNLRTARFLARLVLAWFVLCLGAAAAASAMQPAGMQLVCSGGGIKVLPAGGGEDAAPRVGLDCPLCSPAVVPPPAPVSITLAPAVRAPVLPVATHEQPQRPATSPPARGPPAAA